MSYIAKKGKAAAESAKADNSTVDYSNYLKSFRSGTNYVVRVPSAEDYVEYWNHSVYKVFYSCPCMKAAGQGEDLYDKAVDVIYNEANKLDDGDEKDKLLEQARQLKARPRYLFGFFDLEDGEPFVIDVSKNQAQTFINAIEKFEKKISKVAFEIEKQGSGTSTTVSMTPVMDMEEDLNDKQKENFEATADKEFPEEIFENVLRIKPENDQLADLKNFGFDVSKIGYGGTEDANTEEEAEENVAGPDNF